MLSQAGPSHVTAGGDQHSWWLSGRPSPAHSLVKLELETSVQMQILARGQWAKQACALLWWGV